MRRIIRRKNRSVAVVACARKLAVLQWHVLSSREPFRCAPVRRLQTKYARLRVRATVQRRTGGAAKGTRRSAQYGHGRTRAVPSLPQVPKGNGLPEGVPLAKGERVMPHASRPLAACALDSSMDLMSTLDSRNCARSNQNQIPTDESASTRIHLLLPTGCTCSLNWHAAVR